MGRWDAWWKLVRREIGLPRERIYRTCVLTASLDYRSAREGLPRIGTIDTSLVRFTQSSVSQRLRTGEHINDVVKRLNGPGGDAWASSFEPIRIFGGAGGQLLTLDNRRLLIFSQAGREVPYVWATSREVSAQAFKFTATAEQAGGWFVRVK